MSKKIKIFEDDKQIYEGILTINTAILKGQIYEKPKKTNDSTHFRIRMSNGKNKETDQWYQSTFANCSAFGQLGEEIFKRYEDKDEIWLIARYYCNKKEEKVYKGFIVRDVINMKKEPCLNTKSLETTDDLPF